MAVRIFASYLIQRGMTVRDAEALAARINENEDS